MKPIKTVIILCITLLFFGCFKKGLSGTYVGKENAFFEKMSFTSKDKVELTFFGSTTEASYTIEDGKVKISNTGENQILTITDDGCLDGGGFIGTYCKE